MTTSHQFSNNCTGWYCWLPIKRRIKFKILLCTIHQALTLAMCPLFRMPFWGCRASSGHHNWFSTGPRGQCFLFIIIFFSASYAAVIFSLGIGKTRKATLIRTYFSLYIGIWVITCFWGASGFFGGPVDFLIHWPPGPVVATVQCQGLIHILMSRRLGTASLYLAYCYGCLF